MFEDIKEEIINCKSQDKQYNCQTRKDKSTTNDLQNTTQKTNDRATCTQLKTGDKYKLPGSVSSACSTCSTRCDTLVTNQETRHE